MNTSRREFVAMAAGAALSAAAGSSFGAAASRAKAGAGREGGLKILILGGTGFLGPAVIDSAKARGHSVTIFNRGRREKFVGARDGIEKLYGNRDPNKHAGAKFVDGKEVDDESTPKGLKELEGRSFDAVVDTSGYVPRIAKASSELLAPNVKQYVFISTLSVYKSNDKPGLDESDVLATVDDPTIEDLGPQSENYGALKALCEQAVEKAMPGRTTNIRPGYIVGPGDTSDRFTYWPVRFGRGGEVLCPGGPDEPVQYIDVRDLADWIVTCIENKTVGVFNATGPEKLTSGELLAACKKVGAKESAMTWVPYDALNELGCPVGMLPILLPSSGETAGFHTRRIGRAIGAGLKFRPVQVTCQDTLDWWPKAVELRTRVMKEQAEAAAKDGRTAPQGPDPSRLRAGLPPDREEEILKGWKESPQRK